MNAPSPLSGFKPHKLSVGDVLTLERSGAFAGLPRLELLDGTLYEMSPQTSRHVVAKNELGYLLRVAVQESGAPLSVLIEPTLRTDDNSAPEPDIAILTQLRVEGYYPASLVRLAVEVAVTTIDTDLRYKKTLYAVAGIPEYWVVDVEAACVHVFWAVLDGSYSESRIIPIGASLASQTITGLSVETSGLV